MEVVKGKDLNQQKLNLRKLLLTATDQFIDKQYLIYSGKLTEEETNRIITDVFKQDIDTWYEMAINLIVFAQADIHASRSIAKAFYNDCSDNDFYYFYSFIREQYENNLYRGNLEMLDNGVTSTIHGVLFNEIQKVLEEITPEILKGKDYYYDPSEVDEDEELAEA